MCAQCNFCYLVQEYDEQGRVETEKALNKLREFFRKNDSDVWEIIGKLKDANRFDICDYTHTHTHTPSAFFLLRD